MREIWWVRHAESVANAGEKTDGSALIPLTRDGKERAAAWAAGCARSPDWIVSSPYLRALETAAPLRVLHPAAKFEEWPVQEFTFLDESRCRQTTTEQRRPFVARYWESCLPDYVDGPGAESFAQFFRRILSTLDRLRALDSSFTIVFSHEHVMRAVAWLMQTRITNPDAQAMRSYDAWRTNWHAPSLSTLPTRLDANGGSFELLPLCPG